MLRMEPSISLAELIEIGAPQVTQIENIAKRFPDPDSPEACTAFKKQVFIVEGVVQQIYRSVASMSRKTETLSDIADMWEKMGRFCDVALETLRALKDRYANCGAPELYNLVLDYKLACDKRYKGVLEEISCLDRGSLPTQLFPQSI